MTRTATRHTVTLYDLHKRVINDAAKLLGLEKNRYYVSPSLQYIIEDWARNKELRAIQSSLNPRTKKNKPKD